MIRLITSIIAFASFLSLIPETGSAAEEAGPHIPLPKGEVIHGWEVFGINITNTIFSTWIFMVLMIVLIGVFHIAITTDRLPRLKAFGLDIVSRILAYTTGLLGDK